MSSFPSPSRLRTIRALGISVAGALLLSLLVNQPAAASAAGADSIPTLDDAVLVEDNAHFWNNNAYDQAKLLTVGDYQYVIYYDSDLHVTLARRDLTSNAIQKIVFPEIVRNPTDTHNNSVLGVSYEDGRLHLSFDHHGQPLRYRVSEPGFVTAPPATISLADFEPAGPLIPPGAGLEKAVTYPRFVNTPDGGLIFYFRDGTSGNGELYQHRYDATTGDWTREGPLFSRAGTYAPWNNETNRSGYEHDILFDADGRLHLSWTWRETPTWESNHDINYAYSDDDGRTWFNDSGTLVGDLAAGNPIDLADDTEVVSVPTGTALMNQGVMVLDADQQPHIITYIDADGAVGTGVLHNVHYVHYWRESDGTWSQSFIDDTSVRFDPTKSYVHREALRRGDAFFDSDGVLHFTSVIDGVMYQSTSTEGGGWSDWATTRVSDGPLGLLDHGPKYDRVRMQQDGVMSIAASRVQPDGSTDLYLEDYTLEALTAPAAPTLKVVLNQDSSVRIAVDGAERGAQYLIEREDVAAPGYSVIDADFGAHTFLSQFTDSTVSAGTTYRYRVTAVNAVGSSAPATLVVPAASAWRNYTIEADVTVVRWSAGIVFRATPGAGAFDTGDFYWWAIQPDRDGGKLVRIVFDGGVVTRLPEIALPASVTTGSTHAVKITANGSLISTWIDGVLVDQVTDSTHATGTVGIRHGSSDGDAARYNNLRVTRVSTGETLYSFRAPSTIWCGNIIGGLLAMYSGERCLITEP